MTPGTGVLDILSVGRGHLRLVVDPSDPKGVEDARRTIEDMMARGYSIFVETDDGTKRVKAFNAKRMTYLIDPPTPAADDPLAPQDAAANIADGLRPCGCGPRGRHKRSCPLSGRVEVPVHKAKATAVGRTAGG